MAALEPPAAELAPAATRAGVVDLYRGLWSWAATAAERYHLALASEIVLIAVWLAVRTVSGAEGLPYLAWAVAAALLGLVAPASGLVVLAAIAPFDEPYGLGGDVLGFKHLLVWAVGLGVLPRLLLDRFGARRFPWSPPFLLAAGIAAGTALGVVNTFRHFGRDEAILAGQNWLAGVGAAMVVLAVAVWAASRGQLRPFYVAVGAAVVAGVIALTDWFDASALRDGPLGWLLSPKRFKTRLSGIIGSPNAMEALLIGPTALLICLALLGRDLRWRLPAALAVVPLLGALYYTYSRAALVGIWLTLVLVAWQVRRALGIGLFAAGVVAAVLLMPGYLEVRSEAIEHKSARPNAYFVASDQQRFQAWGAAIRMWLDRPFTGHGFRSYKELGARYGDERLNSPHNEWLRLFAEEGVVVGAVGIGFAATTALWLARRRGWLGSGLLAAFAGWLIAATFNNPFLFIQVSVIAFTLAGTGLALAARPPPAPARGPLG